jgi:hypothetical protein
MTKLEAPLESGKRKKKPIFTSDYELNNTLSPRYDKKNLRCISATKSKLKHLESS